MMVDERPASSERGREKRDYSPVRIRPWCCSESLLSGRVGLVGLWKGQNGEMYPLSHGRIREERITVGTGRMARK